MNGIEQGRAHLANGDFEQAIVAFWTAARTEGSINACIHLGATLAQAGRWDELVRVVEAGCPPVLLFHQVCLALMRRGAYRTLGQIHREIPETHVVAPLGCYFAGVALIAEGRLVESLEWFNRFKLMVLHNIAHYRPLLPDQAFNVLFRQGTLVEPAAYVAALDDGSLAVAECDPQVMVRQRAETAKSSCLFACCLNDLYFLRFADSLAASLAAACGKVDLHFHVVGQQKDCSALFAALEARYPEIGFGLSLEPEPLAAHAIYYACNRFVVMPQLVDVYGRDIIMLDADGLVQQDLTALYEDLRSAVPAADFACFDTGRTEPASVYQATLMYFADSPGCRDFVRLLRRFVFSKLGHPPEVTWMLDQAALFSVGLYLERKEGGDFRFCRLNRLTGCDLSEFAQSVDAEDDKHALIEAGYLRA